MFAEKYTQNKTTKTQSKPNLKENKLTRHSSTEATLPFFHSHPSSTPGWSTHHFGMSIRSLLPLLELPRFQLKLFHLQRLQRPDGNLVKTGRPCTSIVHAAEPIRLEFKKIGTWCRTNLGILKSSKSNDISAAM